MVTLCLHSNPKTGLSKSRARCMNPCQSCSNSEPQFPPPVTPTYGASHNLSVAVLILGQNKSLIIVTHMLTWQVCVLSPAMARRTQEEGRAFQWLQCIFILTLDQSSGPPCILIQLSASVLGGGLTHCKHPSAQVTSASLQSSSRSLFFSVSPSLDWTSSEVTLGMNSLMCEQVKAWEMHGLRGWNCGVRMGHSGSLPSRPFVQVMVSWMDQQTQRLLC